MRLEHQTRWLVLLSLFSFGMCLPVVCLAGQVEENKTSLSTVEECTLKETFNNAESGTAFCVETLSDFPLQCSVECVLESIAVELEQTCLQADVARAPPAS